jgi:ABC-2 type transport system ATP-binding protein
MMNKIPHEHDLEHEHEPPPAIRAQALTVVRGGTTVVSGLDFTVPTGSVTGLLGPSGCGKTTLMRAIVGAQARVGGTIEVLGRPAGSAGLRHRIGYVTQSPSVYRDLTARQNLDYYAAVLLGRPELLVLDEPTVGLDPALRRELWHLFHGLARERGATLLISSHVMDEADRCERLLLMREGRILADDTPDALRGLVGGSVEDAFLRLVDADTVRA